MVLFALRILPRWTTLGPCTAWLALSCVVHSLLPRAWARAFSKQHGSAQDVSLDDAGGGQADFQVIMGARIRKGSSLLSGSEEIQNAVCVAVMTDPLDEFVRSFLDVDVSGNARGTKQRTIFARCRHVSPDSAVLTLRQSSWQAQGPSSRSVHRCPPKARE